jgi:TetR/AcrR family transcriptional repressor of mexJK operon
MDAARPHAHRRRITDPQRAARQFMALVTDDAFGRSNFGARVLAAEDLDQPIRDGVDTFLAAFG